MNFSSAAQRLLQPDLSIDKRLQVATDIRERIEIVYTSEFSNFLKSLFPVFKQILRISISPQFKEGNEQKLRNVLLEILNRLPNNDLLKPYVLELLKLSMEVLAKDNEENALICLRIIFDLHKNYRPSLESEVQPFLDLVLMMYKNLQNTVRSVFAPSSGSISTSTASSISDALPKPPAATLTAGRPASSMASTSSLATAPSNTGGAASGTSTLHMGATTPGGSKAASAVGSLGTASQDSATSSLGSGEGSGELLAKSTQSFKVLTECPLIVMLLFQLYPRYIQSNIPSLIPSMMQALSLRAPSAAEKLQKARYSEFLACQVKTLSFLTYLLRGFTDFMRPYEEQISNSVIQLLMACPAEAVATRKELLVATRHILATDFRKGFFNQVDLLLDEKVLIGQGRASHEVLRPLAYSTLADLVHHVRSKLSLAQLSRIIYLFSRNIHDPSLPISIQTTSVRLLLNLVDFIFHNNEPDPIKGRVLLVRILRTLVNKFSTLRQYIPKVLQAEEERAKDAEMPNLVSAPSLAASVAPNRERAIRRVVHGPPEVLDSVRDVKALMKTMILGLKTVIWCVGNYRLSQDGRKSAAGSLSGEADNSPDKTKLTVSEEERRMIAKFLKCALSCCMIYRHRVSQNQQEEKEVLDHFAGAFTVLEAPVFRDVFGQNINILFHEIVRDSAMLTIPQHFLANSSVSACFAELLLAFLVKNMDKLDGLHTMASGTAAAANGAGGNGKPSGGEQESVAQGFNVEAAVATGVESPRPSSAGISDLPSSPRPAALMSPAPITLGQDEAATVLRLFKIVFGSVTLIPENESVLRPFLQKIVMKCMKYASESKEPINFYFLLRALFRSISGGKYDTLYKEFQPLLPNLLPRLVRLQEYTEDDAVKEVVLELCLTVPARLSSLLHHLPLLMRPVVIALHSKEELVTLGLRTLEFWVDNLNPDFLYPVMSSQDMLLSDLMSALCSHLKPSPAPCGALALRLLGKLGGRSRRFLNEPLQLHAAGDTRTRVIVDLAWELRDKGNTRLTLQLGPSIDVACDVVRRLTVSGGSPWSAAAGISSTGVGGIKRSLSGTPVSTSHQSHGASHGSGLDATSSPTAATDTEALTETQLKKIGLHNKHQALRFIIGCLAVLIHKGAPDDVMNVRRDTRSPSIPAPGQESPASDPQLEEVLVGSFTPSSKPFVPHLVESEILALKKLLTAVINACVDVDLTREAKSIFKGLCVHFTLLIVSHTVVRSTSEVPYTNAAAFSDCDLKVPDWGFSAGVNEVYLWLMNDVIVESLSDENPRIVKIGAWALKVIIETLTVLSESEAEGLEHGGYLLHDLLKKLTHACYKKSWRSKISGCRGISVLVHLLPDTWTLQREIVLTRALLFVLGDHPLEVSSVICEEAKRALTLILRKCHQLPVAAEATAANKAIQAGQSSESATNKETVAMEVEGGGSSDDTGGTRHWPASLTPHEAFVALLVMDLVSSKLALRGFVESTLHYLAKVHQVTVGDLVAPSISSLSSVVFGKPLRLVHQSSQVGYMEALAFLLSLDRPLLDKSANEVFQFLQETLTIADTEGQGDGISGFPGSASSPSLGPGAGTILDSGVSPGLKASGQSTATTSSSVSDPFEQPRSVQLRIAAIRVSSAIILHFSERKEVNEARNRVIGTFFKSLTCQVEEVVEAAHEALAQTIAANRRANDKALPKELLQSSLRPILRNLADFKELSMPLLRALSRLLQLLSNCFNVTLGEKLLEHLGQWAEPDKIIALGKWKRGSEPEVAAALIELFHLLPPSNNSAETAGSSSSNAGSEVTGARASSTPNAEKGTPATGSSTPSFAKGTKGDSKAGEEEEKKVDEEATPEVEIVMPKFLEPLVKTVVQLEAVLHRYDGYGKMTSPYRAPLTLFLNRYPKEAAAFFLQKERLLNSSYSSLFQAILKSKEAGPLREYLTGEGSAELIIRSTFVAATRHQASGLAEVPTGSGSDTGTPIPTSQPGTIGALYNHHTTPRIVSEITATVISQGSHSALTPQQFQQIQAQTQAQIQSNAQRVHQQALLAAQRQGLSPQQAQAQAHQAQRKYLAKTVYDKALMAAQAQGLPHAQAQVQAQQAQQKYLANLQAQLSQNSAQMKANLAGQQVGGLGKGPYSAQQSASMNHALRIQNEAMELHLQGLLTLRTLVRLDPQWLQRQSLVVEYLRKLWRSTSRLQRLMAEDKLQMKHQMESKLIVKCLIHYCRMQTDDVQVLFEMLTMFLQRTLVDFSFLKDFYYEEVTTFPTQHRKAIVHLFLRMLREPNTSQELKVQALQLLVIPILSKTFEDPAVENASVVDGETIGLIMRDMLAADHASYSEALRIELLQLATLLIEHMGLELLDHRKELIKFAWNHLKSEDTASKQWAYVNVCRFIAVYDTPPKIILQVYVALLRTYQSDAKVLVRTALDILFPALKKRLPPMDFIKAIKWTKKIIYEEGHALPQLVHIWQLLVRHPQLFYASRSQFVPQMVNSLNRLALPPNCPLENRLLAISLADLIIAWDQTRQRNLQTTGKAEAEAEAAMKRQRVEDRTAPGSSLEPTSAVQGTGGSGAPSSLPGASSSLAAPSHTPTAGHKPGLSPKTVRPSAAPVVAVAGTGQTPSGQTASGGDAPTPTGAGMSNEDEFKLNPAMIEMVVNFLVRVALGTADMKETSKLSSRCLELLDKALDTWPGANVKFGYLEKLLTTAAAAANPRQGSSSTNPTSSMDKSPLQSVAVLKVTLTILRVTLKPAVVQVQGKNVFFLQHAMKIQKLLEPCFTKTDETVQELLREVVGRIMQLYPFTKPVEQVTNSKFYHWLRETINRKILQAVTEGLKEPTPTASSSKGAQAPVSAAAATTPAAASSLPIILLLSKLCGINPKYLEHHANALLRLAHRLTRDHIQSVVAKASSKDSLESRASKTREMMATPSQTIYLKTAELASRSALKKTAQSSGPQTAPTPGGQSGPAPAGGSQASSVASAQGIGASGFALSKEEDTIKTLILCIELLGQAFSRLGDARKSLLQVFGVILENSDSVPLLLALMRFYSVWIFGVTPGGSGQAQPLNVILQSKEKMALLPKLGHFERLDEVTALPLTLQSHEILLRLFEAPDSGNRPGLSSQVLRPFMAGVLSPDPSYRKRFFEIFAQQSGKGPIAKIPFLFKGVDWEACASRFWIACAVDLIASGIHTASPPALAAGTNGAPWLVVNSSSGRLPTAVRTLLASHSRFLEKVRTVCSTSQLLQPMRDLCHLDVSMCNSLWMQLLPAAWGVLTEPLQSSLVPGVISLLAKPYHRRQLQVLPWEKGICNVIRSMLQAIVLCRPQPAIPSELLTFLSKTFYVWHTALPLLQYHSLSPSTPEDEREKWVAALAEMYIELSDEDMMAGLTRRFANQQETKDAVLLESHGFTRLAQEMYLGAISKVHSNRLQDPSRLSKFEMKQWEDRWVGTAKHLCQWQLLGEFAQSISNPELALECTWKQGDWTMTKTLLNSKNIQAAQESGHPVLKLMQVFVSLQESKVADAERHLAEVVQSSLQKWSALPSLGSTTHEPLLHLFHRIAEAQESTQMTSEIVSASRSRKLPEIKAMLSTWRERLPNKWDSIVWWDDILSWRLHMFSTVTNTFTWADAQQLACLHDTPWTVIKLAHTARKQGLTEVCLNSLAKLYTVSTMDVQDAFQKLREQIVICYENPSDHRGGLNIINNTNLDYFSPQQKAELFRLKSLFLYALGGKSEANQALSHSLQISDNYAKSWLSWGTYCDRLFKEQKQIQLAVQAMTCYLQAVHHRSDSARLMLARVLWLLSTDDDKATLARCFEAHGKQLPIWIWIVWIPQLLTALSRPEAPQVRNLLRGLAAKFPQALYYTMRAYLLEKREVPVDKQTPSASGSEGASGGGGTPSGSSGSTVSTTDSYVSTSSGQVVLLPAGSNTARLHELVPGAVGTPQPTPTAFNVLPSAVLSLQQWRAQVAMTSGVSTPLTAVQYTEDLMSFLRRHHASVAGELEAMLEELIIRFRPDPEEELLGAVHALLVKCVQIPQSSAHEPVPASLQATLERVCRKFFAPQTSTKSLKHSRFVVAYKEPFERDFLLESEAALSKEVPTGDAAASVRQSKRIKEARADRAHPDHGNTLQSIIQRLKKWKHVLQARIRETNSRLNMEDCSRHLLEFTTSDIEVPGQYLTDKEPMAELHVKLNRFESKVDIVHRSGSSQRRLAMRGSNGKLYYFLVQFFIPYITRTDERMVQLHLLFNTLCEKHQQTRRRNIHYQAASVIPITPRVRLLSDHVSFVTLGELYELDCLARGADPDGPMTISRELLGQTAAPGGASASPASPGTPGRTSLAQAKLGIFDEICSKHVSERILSTYIHRIMSSPEEMWIFKRQFAMQLGIMSLLSYCLSIGDRTPHKIVFSKETGRIIGSEFRPSYSNQGYLETSETVPFRLTRNLAHFLTPLGVEGVFSNTMTAIAQALVSRSEVLENQLCLFLRDDLISWHASKTQPKSESEQRKVEKQLRDRVGANTKKILDRIHSLAPALPVSSPLDLKGQPGMKNVQVNHKVNELIEAATSKKLLCQMSPSWMPWV